MYKVKACLSISPREVEKCFRQAVVKITEN